MLDLQETHEHMLKAFDTQEKQLEKALAQVRESRREYINRFGLNKKVLKDGHK